MQADPRFACPRFAGRRALPMQVQAGRIIAAIAADEWRKAGMSEEGIARA
jgi:hypothetical protein